MCAHAHTHTDTHRYNTLLLGLYWFCSEESPSELQAFQVREAPMPTLVAISCEVWSHGWQGSGASAIVTIWAPYLKYLWWGGVPEGHQWRWSRDYEGWSESSWTGTLQSHWIGLVIFFRDIENLKAIEKISFYCVDVVCSMYPVFFVKIMKWESQGICSQPRWHLLLWGNDFLLLAQGQTDDCGLSWGCCPQVWDLRCFRAVLVPEKSSHVLGQGWGTPVTVQAYVQMEELANYRRCTWAVLVNEAQGQKPVGLHTVLVAAVGNKQYVLLQTMSSSCANFLPSDWDIVSDEKEQEGNVCGGHAHPPCRGQGPNSKLPEVAAPTLWLAGARGLTPTSSVAWTGLVRDWVDRDNEAKTAVLRVLSACWPSVTEG